MVSAVNPLPPPDLPQMTADYSISLNDLNVAGGVFVRIQQYEDAARGDYITTLWDNKPVKEVLVDDLSSDFPVVVVITDDVSVGAHFVKYTAKDIAGNIGKSTGINVNIIDGKPVVKYPAPVFTDAVDGIINQKNITASGGTHVHVFPYVGIAANDIITLFWKGLSASGDITDAGVDSHVILTSDINAGAVFLIPAGKLVQLKDKGTVTASYQVRRDGVVLGISEFSKVKLDLDGGDNKLSMLISTGAANTDYDAIHLYPFNQGVLRGPAGATIILSAVGDAVFNESGTSTYRPVLNESGESSFKLRSAVQSNSEISAEVMSNPGVSVQQLIRFGAYVKGNGNIQYINYSTGAPSNGLTPCSVYLKATQSSGARAEMTRVRVVVSGSAVIDGYSGQSADILLNTDKSAEIDVINSVAEIVNVELSLPESSGSINRFTLVFNSF